MVEAIPGEPDDIVTVTSYGKYTFDNLYYTSYDDYFYLFITTNLYKQLPKHTCNTTTYVYAPETSTGSKVIERKIYYKHFKSQYNINVTQ